ncbi:MAG: hypothetical protein JSV89_18185 [Spirochaetaceae bacterium]|nr:MAG: hypothetical protein JSV89_18185 [Spirochaetaceae bacterium]
MGSSIPVLQSPHLWLVIAGLFCGAALNRALRPAAYPRWRASDAERAKTTKWTFFTLYLCLAVVAALGAVFAPGPEKILDLGLLYLFLGSTVLFFLVFHFKKTFGLVAVILAIALAGTLLAFLQSLNAFTGETEIGQVRALEVQDNRMKLEILPDKGESVITWLEGTYFAPVVKVVIFDDYLVFLGTKTWYRFEGISSFEVERTESGAKIRQQDSDYYFSEPSGITAKLWELYERYDSRIPGVRTVQIEMDLKRARELSVYSLRVQNDGGLQIIEIY